VKRNAEKDDPSAYCATIQRAVEKINRDWPANEDSFRIVKIDPERRFVFGWASVAIRKDGTTIVDSQGDVIDPRELEDAAYDFVLKLGDADEMHEAEPVGRLIESLVVTPEKLEKLGLPPDSLPQGLWLGFYITKDETWGRVKKGELRAFSIEGIAEREPT
jgi:Putative phage serine protease XkdF